MRNNAKLSDFFFIRFRPMCIICDKKNVPIFGGKGSEGACKSLTRTGLMIIITYSNGWIEDYTFILMKWIKFHSLNNIGETSYNIGRLSHNIMRLKSLKLLGCQLSIIAEFYFVYVCMYIPPHPPLPFPMYQPVYVYIFKWSL